MERYRARIMKSHSSRVVAAYYKALEYRTSAKMLHCLCRAWPTDGAERYNRAVEHLLRATARAEARHFWFRGFRRFVTPLVRSALRGRTAPRILDCGCGTGANLELLGGFGRAYGFDLSEIGPRIAREAGRTAIARATVTAAPFPSGAFDLVTSFDVLYSLEEPRRTGGGRRAVPRPQARRLRRHQRRGDADADRRSLGAQPRTAPLHAVVAPAAARAGRLHDRPPDIHQCDAVPAARDGARVSPVARPLDRGRGATGDRRAGGAPSTGP